MCHRSIGASFSTLEHWAGERAPEDIPRFATAQEYAKRVKLPGDLGWYKNPPGTVAESIQKGSPSQEMGSMVYTCPMHPEVRQKEPGSCPKCGMTLKPEAGQQKEHAH